MPSQRIGPGNVVCSRLKIASHRQLLTTRFFLTTCITHDKEHIYNNEKTAKVAERSKAPDSRSDWLDLILFSRKYSGIERCLGSNPNLGKYFLPTGPFLTWRETCWEPRS
ncbi:Uncharacterized protein HZ326_13805 [Fusarium oxysporum f. sp. albedinis]|nr:Uncharacterized protein HZ326_13805 [Fusarium oxysporum f. sp. albedinis]